LLGAGVGCALEIACGEQIEQRPAEHRKDKCALASAAALPRERCG